MFAWLWHLFEGDEGNPPGPDIVVGPTTGGSFIMAAELEVQISPNPIPAGETGTVTAILTGNDAVPFTVHVSVPELGLGADAPGVFEPKEVTYEFSTDAGTITPDPDDPTKASLSA